MQVRETVFTAVDFTSAEEERAAHALNPYTLAWIKSLRADAAQDRLDLAFDPQNPLQFAQAEAALKGQIQILTHIIDCHELATSGE